MISSTERHFRVDDHANLTDQPDQSAQQGSQVPEDHADVVTASTEHGEKSIAFGSFQGASPQSAVVFHVPDHWLYGAAPPQEFGNRPGNTTLRTADENLHGFHAVAPVSTIDKDHLGPLVGQDLDLFQRLAQRMAIVGIALQRPHSDYKAASVGRGYADLGAKLVALVRLAFRYAVHRWFMQAVELLLVLRLLRQQPVYQVKPAGETDTDVVLAAAGFAGDEIAQLRSAGCVE